MSELIRVQNGIATREPIPDFLISPLLLPESLADLSWTPAEFGLQDSAWWPEENTEGELGVNKKWGAEVLTIDAARKVVKVARNQVNMTAAEKAARDALVAEQWTTQIAARRYTAEIAGTTIDGMPIDTGRDSQGLITGAAVQAIIDPEYSLHWKTSAGFVELTGQQILGVASMVRAHVQACFNREAALLDAVAEGTITAAMLDEGWPA
ncbi:DUF4376 domain-containing protein [Pseudomonas sp. G.S.17]|uniref:DUF4376 domain-containing protein n=1 Tax=Pseudomonas sp. G.S.17 TaxID=3137451 RepID=UPI00311C9F38